MMDVGLPNMNSPNSAGHHAPRRWGELPHDARDSAAGHQRQKIELEALHQFVLELCGPHHFGLAVALPERFAGHAASRVVPTETQLDSYLRSVLVPFTVLQRMDYETGQRPDVRFLDEALGTYIGKYVSRAQWEQMGNEKIALQPMRNRPFELEDDGSNAPTPIDESGEAGAPADWFLEPDATGAGYGLPEAAYGNCLGVKQLVQEILEAYGEARSHTLHLMRECDRVLMFQIDAPGAPRTPRFPLGGKVHNVGSYEAAHEAMMRMLHPDSPSWRRLLLERMRAMANARGIAVRLKALAAEALTHRSVEVHRDGQHQPKESLLFTTLTTVDVLQHVFEDFGPGDAANFMLAYGGYFKDEADPLIVEALKKRFPRLHIFGVNDPKHASERFPHHVNVDGSGVIYKESLLHIPIGFITSRLRARVRAEGRAKELREMQEREGEYVEALPPFAPEDMGDYTKDHGYNRDEEVLMQYEGHMSHPEAPSKRVRNNGWRVKAYTLDPDHQYAQADPLRYFAAPPELRVFVVHAESRLRVLRSHPHGGLEPNTDLRAAKAKMTLCAPANTMESARRYGDARERWQLPYQYDLGPGQYARHDDQFVPLPRGGCRAVVARFWPSCLSKQHEGHKFRIVVECRGMRRTNPGSVLTIRAETAAYTFQYDKKGGTRRKAASPAPSPSAAQCPRR